MRILVTGGVGFIGSYVVDQLIDEGHRVAVLDNVSRGNLDYLNSHAVFYKRDIVEPLFDIFENFNPQIVVHLAGLKNIRNSLGAALIDAKINILGGINLIENCRKYHVKKIIFLAGGAIYGNAVSIPTSEDEKEFPISPHGIAKLTIEKYLHYYHKVHGLPFISFRCSNVYGPREDARNGAGVVSIFITKLLNRQPPIILGDGNQTRDFVYVTDIAKAVAIAVKKDIVGTFNISAGEETSVNELLKILKSHLGVDVESTFEDISSGEQMRSCLNPSKFQQATGWNPEYDLNKGLIETIRWHKEKNHNSNS